MFENLDIKISNQMLAIISEIDEFKGSWKLWQQMSPEKLQALKKVATIESVGSSNRIEGNKLSDKQVEELLSRINKQSFANRDEEEVAGYAKLADTIFEDWEVIPLSENYIKQLHKILLEYSLKDEKHKGEYKKISNAVAAYDNNGKDFDIEMVFKLLETKRYISDGNVSTIVTSEKNSSKLSDNLNKEVITY